MSTEVWWGSGSTPVWRVLLGFAAKGVPYTSHLLTFSAGDTQKPEFLALNPRGKVPVIRDGSFTLNESLAILAWLDKKHPQPPLFGETAEEHGLVWKWCLELENHGFETFHEVVRPIFRNKVEGADGDAVRAALPAVHAELERLQAAVAGGYLVGGRLSAADLVWFPEVATLVRATSRPAAKGFELGVYPFGERYAALLAWVRRIEAIPGFETTIPPHWLEGEGTFPRPLQ